MKTSEIIDAIAVVDAKRDAGEIDDKVWQDTMEAIDGELEDKLDAMEYVMEGYENDLAVLQKEEERLKEVVKNKKSLENRIKNFKRFMGYFLEASGKKKVTTDNTSTRCITTNRLLTWLQTLNCRKSISRPRHTRERVLIMTSSAKPLKMARPSMACG